MKTITLTTEQALELSMAVAIRKGGIQSSIDLLTSSQNAYPLGLDYYRSVMQMLIELEMILDGGTQAHRMVQP